MNVSRKRVAAPKKKRVYKKRYTALYPARNTFRAIAPRPAGGNGQNVTFIYTQKGTITGAALGAAAFYQFRLNSIFDPDLTGAGTQPVGHDQYALLYEKYRVYEASYKVTFMNQSTTADALVAVASSDESSTTTDWDRLVQNGQCEWKTLTFRGGCADEVSLMGTIDLAAAQGMSKKNFWADDLQEATFGSNPAEVYILNLVSSAIGTGSGPNVSFFIEIRYKARVYGNVLTIAS